MNVCVEPEEIPAFFIPLFAVSSFGFRDFCRFNRKFVASNGLSLLD